jgi:phosphoribosylamine--glycine ligase
MKFRLISKNADGVALALQIAKEGHKVDFWVKDKGSRTTYRGIMAQAESWNKGLTADTIVFFDMVGMGGFAEALKKDGYCVFGGGKLNDALELNREFAMRFAKTSKLKLPAYGKFDRFDQAIEFVKRSGKAWVFKPANNQLPEYTYVSTDADDMIGMLTHFKTVWPEPFTFILQEKIEGVEVSVEGFYLNGELVPDTLNSTLESKRLFEGDRGPNTGCMGSVVWFWQKHKPKLYRLTLQKIEPLLKQFKYSGPLDVNCIVSEEDKLPYFLEFTTRFGYDAIYALFEGMGFGMADFIACLADGKPPVLKRSFDWLGAVRVSIPPYPYITEATKSANRPIRGIDDHTWLLDAKADHERLVTAGVDGVVCEVTARGKTMNALDKALYSRVKPLRIPDKQYRSDVVKTAKRKVSTLKKWKFFGDGKK